MTHDFVRQRKQMVAWLSSQGIRDPRVLAAFAAVPREYFVDASLHHIAYADRALPTCLGQTISQPLMVAVMTQALQLTGDERVLEIGTGSGYQAAILSHLVDEVDSIEHYPELAQLATSRLAQLDRHNVSVHVADGSLGWPDGAPYERILVTAAAPDVPYQLLSQLIYGGLLVIPVGDQEQQDLRAIQRLPDRTLTRSLGNCVFVPLIGEAGWHE